MLTHHHWLRSNSFVFACSDVFKILFGVTISDPFIDCHSLLFLHMYMSVELLEQAYQFIFDTL